jgi:phosphoribosylaminoimidazole-succinocarboxamide synthase
MPTLKKLRSGKVRDLYEYGEELWLVASDRISAFDVILPNPIPGKGEVLTQLARHWFLLTAPLCPNHVLGYDLPPGVGEADWKNRTVRTKRCEVIPMECVARGYLAGSGWKEYQQQGTVGGYALPSGLRESEKLPEPLFTPATKAEEGHDQNVTETEARQIVGDARYEQLRELTLKLYTWAAAYAAKRGIIIADTKFEFGLWEGGVILIDEILTPDSSRFWEAKIYEPGQVQPSYDKQFVRDYLESLDWNKQPPGPELPPPIVEKTLAKYREALQRLTGPETV